MSKKSQAAAEFLSSYGFALLAILIIIVSIAFLGVRNTKEFLPDSCMLNPGLLCIESAASITGFSVVVQNEIGETISLESVSVEDMGGVSCSQASVSELKPGKSAQIDITCNGLASGSRVKGMITGSYTKIDSSLDHNLVGEIIAEVD